MLSEFDPTSKTCVSCSSSDLRTFRANAFDADDLSTISIVECETCHFAWQHPLSRTEAESVKYFQSAYADQGQHSSKYFDPAQRLAVANLELDFVDRLAVQGKRLLDVGAGDGTFALAAANRGWITTAVDPALDSSRFRDSTVRSIAGTIADIPLSEEFDIVTMWDAIEHVSSPVSLLSAVSGLVRRGGWIVVETGNYKSADRVGNDLESWIFQHDHRWYFSPESLANLLGQLGFSDFTYARSVLRPNWAGNPDFQGPSSRQLLATLLKRPWDAATILRRHRDLRLACSWPLGGLGIFCIGARRQ